MKQSIRTRYTIFGAGMIIGFILLNIVLTYMFMIPFSVQLSIRQLNKLAVDIAGQDMQSEEQFKKYIEQLEEDTNTRVTIFDSEENIILTTNNFMSRQDKLRENSSADKLFRENRERIDSGQSVSLSRGNDQDNNSNQIRIFLVKKIEDDRYAVLSRSYRSLHNATQSAIMFELLAGIILLVLGLFVVYSWGGYIVKPIREITDAAEHISNLEFDKKIDVKSEDELGQLARSVNRMSDHLEANVDQMQADIENRKRLVRNLSHEIKSPIAVIMGYADRMKAVISKNPEKAVQYSDIISDESTRVDILVKEMLELSKLEQGEQELSVEKIYAERLFADLKKRFTEEHMGTSIVYEDEYDSDDVIYMDYILAERAIYNLIRNAAIYAAGDPPRINVKGSRVGEYYEIRVYNSGSKVPEEEYRSIWEPFAKVDKARSRSKKGFGVGLSIVREIVEQHNGYYKVENVEDGVEFMISFCYNGCNN